MHPHLRLLTRHASSILAILTLGGVGATGAIPRDTLPLDAPEIPPSYRLHSEFSEPSVASVQLEKGLVVILPKATEHDVAIERPPKGPPIIRVWADGKVVETKLETTQPKPSSSFPEAKINFGTDFTALVKFDTQSAGTLFSKSSPKGKWTPDAKSLFIRNGRLFYEIGSLGSLTGGPKVDNGKPHTAVVVSRANTTQLWLDGKMIAENPQFSKPDVAGDVLKVATTTTDFGGDLTDGKINNLRAWSRALPEEEIALLFKGEGSGANTPDFTYTSPANSPRPLILPPAGTTLKTAWIQALERTDHQAVVAGWNEKSLAEGAQIYSTLCVVCHGTKDQPGSLPTALRFTDGQFKNGADPYSMFITLTKGFGQMVAQPQYTTAQKYAVIQYIRETFLRTSNPSQLTKITPAYLSSLPLALTLAETEKADRSLPQYRQMDFGPVLFWTLQIEPKNIAQKAIAIRLDDGPGGVSKGRAWMIYDHDTMRVATATTGSFVDWKGIAFDGSHGSHTSLTGERHFINPVGPGWASPEGKWNDDRLVGRDNLHYGPLPRTWLHYQGLYLSGNKAVISLTVGGTSVIESPGWLDYGATPVFTRTINVAQSASPLLLRVAPDTISVSLTGDGSLTKEAGFWVAKLPGGAKTRLLISKADPASLAALSKTFTTPLDLQPLTKGGPRRWEAEVTTTSEAGKPDGPFIADTFPLPINNPWQSWMRPGGFDFTPDGKSAIVATWNGDVWRVDGLMAPAPAPLQWHRIATGLFQPLGVKYRGNDLFITCRDQLVCLRDLNGDGEADFIESFNNDHQVTEHFHEFAMGLQIDAAGNFYYAKSARHALTALVPHHGTLLRISADGKRTDIIANGFRAANGVCLNEDGTFFVTDQEGHWTPKNRINRVKPGGFYGNIFGYTDVTDPADSAMQQPMVWMTNAKDRSPAELLWVPKNTWGSLSGSLLNLSYGTGRIFIVPNEEVGGQWQGAVCELPLPAFATGTMRGRFAPDGALYACGLFAWAGNANGPGGFHRIRRTEKPADLPLAIHATPGAIQITFTDPIDPASVKAESFTLKVWSLKRSANYGSNHVAEHPLVITDARLAKDGKTITLTIPTIEPTTSYELIAKLRNSSGNPIDRSIHGTIHQLAKP